MFPHERLPLGYASERFLEWSNDEEMVDVGFSGPMFTWNHGNYAAQKRSARLDRALCDEAWRCLFPEASITHCAHAYSDHSPLLLNTDDRLGVRLGERPFRFQSAWLMHGNFKEFVRANWPRDGRLSEQLVQFATSLRQWNKEEFGHIIWTKNRLRARLAGVQKRLATHTTTSMLKLEHRLKTMLEKTLIQEEILWQQKSRVLWLQAGDRNTKFFHLSTIV